MNDFPLTCIVFCFHTPTFKCWVFNIQCIMSWPNEVTGRGVAGTAEQRPCAVLAGALALCTHVSDFRDWSVVLRFTLLSRDKERISSCSNFLLLPIMSPSVWRLGGLWHHLILPTFFTHPFFQALPLVILLSAFPSPMSTQGCPCKSLN